MAEITYRVGQTVRTKDGRKGVIQYAGKIHMAPGEWLGLELPDASGKNDGSVKGERYFICQPAHGIFVRKESIESVVPGPRNNMAPPTSDPANDTKTRAPSQRDRPGSGTGITADAARKRQSLMSAASARPANSRFNVRSPTKSPVKGTSTSTASITSISRTSTPATITRSSDSSTKSRPSIVSRPSVAPLNTSSNALASSGAPALRTSRPSIATARPSLSTQRTVPQLRPKKIETSALAPSEHGTADRVSTGVRQREPDPATETTEQDEDDFLEDGSTPSGQVHKSPVSAPVAVQPRRTSMSRNGAGTVESRTAQQRELEELKVKLRTMENQQKDYHEKAQQLESVQSEKDKYENIVQALQKKLKSNQQEMSELRSKCAAAESRVASIELEFPPGLETDLERMRLDQEIAEENMELLKSQLSALKDRCEELELELEVTTEEKRELESVMSPDERAETGWLQMQEANQRLRDALVRLRDMSQETEFNLRNELEELKTNLEEAENSAHGHLEATEELRRLKANNLHLMEQLEAAEANDEVVEAMEAQREQQMAVVEQLRRQVQDLEEHIQVTDELEVFHVDEEKRLYGQLDDAEALINDTARRNVEQERIIEDLEYTLAKFKDVVQALHNDLEELRHSKDISEREALEMSSKSRAMMDLNLKLQSSATKSQAKAIETELVQVQATLSTRHVEILNLFTLESYDTERNSVAVLLSFGRIKAKAGLVTKLLDERHRQRGHLSSGTEIFEIFNIIESVQWIQSICQQFEAFLGCCSHAEFAACGQALLELEPVERTITGWLEALRRDEMGSDGSEQLKRTQGVLLDLAEKLIVERAEYKILDIQRRLQLVEDSSDGAVNMFTTLTKLVQSRLGTSSDEAEDDDMQTFSRKMNHLSTKARTLKYTTSKVVQQVQHVKSRLLCPTETNWILFEDAERHTRRFLRQVRELCLAVVSHLSKTEDNEALSYLNVVDTMFHSWRHSESSSNGHRDDSTTLDGYALIIAQLAHLQSAVDDLADRSFDIDSMMGFDRGPAPWVVRSKELRAQKIVPPEVQEEITALDRRNHEMALRIADRESTIEEMLLRVEVAEKRAKDLRSRDNDDRALKEELEALRSSNQTAEKTLDQLRAQYETQKEQLEADRTELEALRASGTGRAGSFLGPNGIADDQSTAQLKFDNSLLLTEKTSLEAAVRFLQSENHSLRIPTTETLISAAKHTWLDQPLTSSTLRHPPNEANPNSHHLESETTDLYTSLITAARTLKPIRLSTPPSLDAKSPLPPITTRPLHTKSTRHIVLRQRETLESWDTWRADLLGRAKLAGNANRAHQPRNIGPRKRVRIHAGGLVGDDMTKGATGFGRAVVEIVQ